MRDLPSDQQLGSAQQSISREDLPSDQESSVVISSVQQRSPIHLRQTNVSGAFKAVHTIKLAADQMTAAADQMTAADLFSFFLRELLCKIVRVSGQSVR